MFEEITLIYATEWCWDCRRARKFFNQRQIPYRWINIDEDRDGERFVKDTNRGNRSVPTILLPDGRILVEPSDADLTNAFPPASS